MARLGESLSEPILDKLAISLILIATAGSTLALALNGDVPYLIFAAVIAGGIAAVFGIFHYPTQQAVSLLWLSVGVNFGLGVTGLLSFGTGSLISGIATATWAIGAARRSRQPTVRLMDIGAEIVGFACAMGLILALART
jgi:hypothetical protein